MSDESVAALRRFSVKWSGKSLNACSYNLYIVYFVKAYIFLKEDFCRSFIIN